MRDDGFGNVRVVRKRWLGGMGAEEGFEEGCL